MWRQESLFHARWVTSIITKGPGDIQLLPINFCYQVLLTACLTATHRCRERSARKISLHFIVHRLKAVSRASQSWRIDLFGTECVGKGYFWVITNKAEAISCYVLPLGTQIKHFFFFSFMVPLLWEFHWQKLWLGPAFLNPGTYNLSGSCYNHSGPSSNASRELLMESENKWQLAGIENILESLIKAKKKAVQILRPKETHVSHDRNYANSIYMC